jgi:SSS family solute:Na+ symporter
MIAVVIAPQIVTHNYNLALPVMMSHFYGQGMLGLGITALLASFMSGMAGNITAFNTVFTYDIYQTYLVKRSPDSHYLKVRKIATVVGTALACTSSFIVLYFNNMMDYMALIATLFISPFFFIFLLGMLWKRPSATAGFYGMLGGLAAAISQYVLYRLGVLRYASPMAANLWSAVWGLAGGLIVMLSLTFLTRSPDPASLKGLVFHLETSRSEGPANQRWYQTPIFFAGVVMLIFVVLNIIFF